MMNGQVCTGLSVGICVLMCMCVFWYDSGWMDERMDGWACLRDEVLSCNVSVLHYLSHKAGSPGRVFSALSVQPLGQNS